MKKRLFLYLTFTFWVLTNLLLSQNTLDLSFTAVDNDMYTQLDSIMIMNRTQGNETMIYFPDTS